MKKTTFIASLIVTIIVCSFFSCQQIKQPPEKAIAQTILSQVDSFAAIKDSLLVAIETGTANEKQLQQLFLQARMAYKKIEWATEYFAPATSRFVNGPPVPEIETSGPQVFEPAGLQVIEGFLFPKYDTLHKKELTQLLAMLTPACNQYKTYFANIDILEWQVFDATKLEVFRILTLGITGFDNPLTHQSMTESGVSLESLKKALSYYIDKSDTLHLMRNLTAARDYLNNNPDFNSFNRANFITDHGNSITIGITKLQDQLKIHTIRYNRLLNQDTKTLFDTNAFKADAYAPDPTSFITDKKVALGKMLFSDPILSSNNKRSCQSCHQPEKAFTDGLVKNTIISGDRLLRRNTPTLLNAALQPSLFYDLKVATLEDQSASVINNTDEMHGSVEVAAKRLWSNETYRKLFVTAFPKPSRSGVDTLEVMNALASYIRSLVSLNSRFDQYMRGNKKAMSMSELNGFNLFMGKARCGTCHYMPLFNGTFPPRFTKIESEVIGVPQSLSRKKADSDMGRFAIVKVASLKRAFKTPTVRNAAQTAPYMHNGVFRNLAQVINFYNNGGGKGLGLQSDNQSLSLDKLKLSTKESNEIIAFIKSLDSK